MLCFIFLSAVSTYLEPFVFQLSFTSWKVLGASPVTIGKAQYMGTNQIMCTLPDPKGSYVIRVQCIDDLWSPRVTLLNFDDTCRSCSFDDDKKCELKVRELGTLLQCYTVMQWCLLLTYCNVFYSFMVQVIAESFDDTVVCDVMFQCCVFLHTCTLFH